MTVRLDAVRYRRILHQVSPDFLKCVWTISRRELMKRPPARR